MSEKKNKKSKVKKKVSKLGKSKVKKRVSKLGKSKIKKRVSKKNIPKFKNGSEKELVFKTRPEWIKSALVNKAKYQKKYSNSIKNNNEFWKKEGKRITWIKPTKKLRMLNIAKQK